MLLKMTDFSFVSCFHYWTSSVKNLWKLYEKVLACFIVLSWYATHEYSQKTLISKGHENGKPMKCPWKNARYNQWKHHERPMKLLAWNRPVKSHENTMKIIASNKAHENTVKIISLHPGPWKYNENYCTRPRPMKIPWKLLHSTQAHENTMKTIALHPGPWKYHVKLYPGLWK